MPRAPQTKPPPQSRAATTPTMRGPTASSHLPAKAAARPRQTMATEKIHTTELKLQSSAAGATTPSARVRAGLNTDQAYTEPMHR